MALTFGLAAQPALAFRSFWGATDAPWGSDEAKDDDSFKGEGYGFVHRMITEHALDSFGFNAATINDIVYFNYMQDFNEYNANALNTDDPASGNTDDPPGGSLEVWADGDKHYMPAHHFDRNPDKNGDRRLDNPPETTEAAFNRGRDFVLAKRREVIRAIIGEDYRAAKAGLGQATHALQDFCSHSSLVDLSPREQQAMLRKVLGARSGTGNLPSAFMLTGAASVDNAGLKDLKSDPYPHDRFAKDIHFDMFARYTREHGSPSDGGDDEVVTEYPEAHKLLNGKAKFFYAYDLAIELTRRYTESIRRAVPRARWQAFSSGPSSVFGSEVRPR
jgi:hypothetical protein